MSPELRQLVGEYSAADRAVLHAQERHDLGAQRRAKEERDQLARQIADRAVTELGMEGP